MKWFELVDSLSRELARNLARFPWRNTALALRQRFKEDQLGLTASSLTFTTTLSLVPLLTVALALFTAFPMFATLQTVLQKWLLQSLIPDNIARQVLGYLTQFSSNASRLGLAGLVIVLSTALTLILTIDNTLNNIWRVKKPRSWTQRVLIYWAALTLGPLLLGASLTMTSYVLSLSSNAVGGGAGLWGGVVAVVQFGLFALGAAAMYRFVPNAEVKWAHAWAGGVFVAVGIELAKKLLTLYLASVPTYAAVYGAFATVPILLLWIYVVWVVVLLGAVLAAYLPSLLAGVARRGGRPGWQFQLAIEVLQALHRQAQNRAGGLAERVVQVGQVGPAGPVGHLGRSGLPRAQIAAHLGVDKVQLEPVLEALLALDWIGTLEATDTMPDIRLILLADPDTTLIAPLVSRLLIYPASAVQPFWASAGLAGLTLRGAMSLD